MVSRLGLNSKLIIMPGSDRIEIFFNEFNIKIALLFFLLLSFPFYLSYFSHNDTLLMSGTLFYFLAIFIAILTKYFPRKLLIKEAQRISYTSHDFIIPVVTEIKLMEYKVIEKQASRFLVDTPNDMKTYAILAKGPDNYGKSKTLIIEHRVGLSKDEVQAIIKEIQTMIDLVPVYDLSKS